MRQWIRDTMTADPPNTLRDFRDRAVKVVAVATDGSVVIKPSELTARQKILAYHVGKHYAVAGGYATEAVVTNQELASKLALPDGTIRPLLKQLRDDKLIEALENGKNILPLASLPRALDELENGKN